MQYGRSDGMVNLALFVESYGANPSFRPKFRYYHWSVALYGSGACIIAAFLISPGASILASLFIGILFFVVQRSEMVMTFGDARRGFLYSRIRSGLLALCAMPNDPKNWRPTITVFSGNPEGRKELIDCATLFECNRGILSVVEIILSDPESCMTIRDNAFRRLELFAQKNNLQFFPDVVVCEDFDQGLRTFIQAHSLRPIKPNIAMFGWPSKTERAAPFISHLRVTSMLGMSCVVMVNPKDLSSPDKESGRIDIWWRGMKNGSLMLLLAHLMCCNREWRNGWIRILRMVSNESEIPDAEKQLHSLIRSSRIDAEGTVLVATSAFSSVFRKCSSDAYATFSGFIPPGDEHAESFFNAVNDRLQGMPPSFLVCSSGDADLLA